MHILHNVPESWRQRIENKPNSDFTKITLIKNNWAPPQYQWDTSKKNKCIFQDVGVKVQLHFVSDLRYQHLEGACNPVVMFSLWLITNM